MSDTSKASGRARPTDEEILSTVHVGTKRKDIRVGFFVLFGLLAFVVVLFWMTDPGTFRGRYTIVTTVPDAGGVRAGDPVQMYGVNLGRVQGFRLVAPGRIEISLEILGEWQIPEGSHTRFGGAGIFGGRTIVIEPGTSDRMLVNGDTIPGEAVSGEGLLGSVDQLSGSASTVLERIQTLLSEQTIGSIQGSAVELEGLLTDLSVIAREQRGALGTLTESLNRAAVGLEDVTTGSDLASAIARADSAMSVLTDTGHTLDTAAGSLRDLLARVERGEGTLGRLATDDALYVNLTAAAESLNALLLDLQANPKKYINISLF